MFELVSRYSKVILAILCLGLSLLSVYFHGRTNVPTRMDQTLSAITSPMLGVFDGLVGGTGHVWNRYLALMNVEEENEFLRRENKRLLGESKKSTRMQIQNKRLKKLVGFKDANAEYDLLAARVLARDISPHYRVVKLSLDVGADSRVRVGMPVVSHVGVVGRVSKVDGASCEVMLMVDARSSMNVRIMGKGVTGTLTGAGVKNEYEAKFRFLYKNKSVSDGDVVVTSGHDQVFPSGLEVGRILSSNSTQSGIYYLYDVAPTVNFSTLEEVFVLLGKSGGDVAADGEEDP